MEIFVETLEKEHRYTEEQALAILELEKFDISAAKVFAKNSLPVPATGRPRTGLS